MADVKKYYWLKLKDTFFNEKEIKKLRKIAGGDTYTVIYLKLQLLSVKTGGKLCFEGVEDTFEEELSLILDEDVDNVKITLAFLQRHRLIEEIGDNEYLLPEAVHAIGSEGDSAERVRRFRNKKALQCNDDVTEVKRLVTSCNTEIEIELEKDNIYSRVVEYLNSKAGTKYKSSSSKTKELINARQNEGFVVEDFIMVIDKKVIEWKGTDLEKFLRPETLFSNKFEGYLNQKIIPKKEDKPEFKNPYRMVD